MLYALDEINNSSYLLPNLRYSRLLPNLRTVETWVISVYRTLTLFLTCDMYVTIWHVHTYMYVLFFKNIWINSPEDLFLRISKISNIF